MKREAVLVVAFLGLWTSPLAGQDVEQLYQQACDGGGMEACHLLGLMYRTGAGVTQDLGNASRLFQKACNGEMWESCHLLGVMYGNGIGVTQDLGRALTLFRQACDGGETLSCSQVDLLMSMKVQPEIINSSEVAEAIMREYPRNLRNDGVGGRVVLALRISETGRVMDEGVFETSGYVELDAAALRVVDVFRFTPMWDLGQVVRAWILLPITFSVN